MDLIDHLNATEIFFDGIHEVKIIEGVVRVALYSRQDSVKVVTARLAIPVSELPEVIQALVIALAEAARSFISPQIGH
jgi:hypothetical protein